MDFPAHLIPRGREWREIQASAHRFSAAEIAHAQRNGLARLVNMNGHEKCLDSRLVGCAAGPFSRRVSVQVARRLNNLEWLAGLRHSRESGNPDSEPSRSRLPEASRVEVFPRQPMFGSLD